MNFYVSICCLLVAASSGTFVNGETRIDNEDNERYGRSETSNETQRWWLEFEDFELGYKIQNDNGELVLLTADQASSMESWDKIDEKILFYLYTKQNPTEYQKLTINYDSSKHLEGTNFNASKNTVFITHGFANSGQGPSCTVIRDAYLRNNDLNVIIVDWGQIAKTSVYAEAALQVENIGKSVARMINYLSSEVNLDTMRTTLVGHSLGAHIMGIAGYQASGTIKYIFGLDPANTMFKHAAPEHRISTLDAEHVQIIHTNGGFLGIWEPIGHSDFYPNGGSSQVGCSTEITIGSCSHSRAWKLFAESIVEAPKTFTSNRCPTIFHVNLALCLDNDYTIMGGLTATRTGIFFLITLSKSPYASG